MATTNKTPKTLRYFWKHAKVYKLLLSLLLITVPIGVIVGDILVPIYYKEIIDAITNFSATDDRLALWDTLLPKMLFISSLWGIVFIAWRVFEFAITKFEVITMRELERSVYKKLQNHSFNFFANCFTGSLVTKANRFVRAFETISDNFLFNCYSNFIRVFAAIAVLFVFVPIMAWILLAWTIVFLVASYIFTKWKLKYDIKNAAADSAVTAELADGMTNIVTTKSFARKGMELQRFWDISQKRFKTRYFAWNLNNYSRAMQAVLMFSLQIGFIFISIRLWINGTISIGTIIMIQLYLSSIMNNLWDIGHVLRVTYQAFADAAEMTEILYKPLGVKDPKKPEATKIIRGKIEFQKVNFDYEKGKPIFQNFNLKIKPGEKVGIVGSSGSGKTTITKLLLRFFDIHSGKITIDNQDISKITQEDLRSNIAFVPQDPILFHRTLLENIQYGNLEANEKAVIATAKMANAHDFIQKCPAKYKTLVGERGIKLSGGERQRISIARAMLKNAPVLILDEATSSLDSNSEVLIQSALEKLMKNRTTIVISHRLSTIQKMDRIIVLEQGEIVEEGTHKELLKKAGAYEKLWSHQAGGFV